METLPEGKLYCRKCTKLLPEKNFYDATDGGFIDSNMKMSVCKSCINHLYNKLHKEYGNMEKAIHKLCISLNIRYSNNAVDATRAHINTLIEKGKNVHSIFGIYKAKLLAVQKSMDKNAEKDMSYEDVSVIFTEKEIKQDEIAIPKEVIDFWGDDFSHEEILYLENEYKNFKQTHKADTYAEIVLLKQVCYTMLNLKHQREEDEWNKDLVKELQDLMKNLAIAPKEVKTQSTSSGEEAFGKWIEDIEKYEPAQWLETDPRGEIYRDVGNIEKYFQDYLVRPLKNFITMSKDFNIEEDITDEDEFIAEYDEDIEFGEIED